MAYAAPNQDPLIGRTIDGRYEIQAAIGEGGMGVVYKARQTSIDRVVAIKMLSTHLAKDPNWVRRFNNEAKACSRLQHPNTIRMFDFGQTQEGRLFMAMEFLDGQPLRHAIAAGAPMAPVRVLKILIQCCASLGEAHAIGIIHRDIKPDNVFLLNLAGSPDFVKVLDFGVAKLLQDNDGMRTQAGVVFGTPQYMSPEQGRGAPLTQGSDLYSLGILAYEMLTGTVPFTDDNPMTVLQMHMRAQPQPLPASVPQSVQNVVMHALTKDPTKRYKDATEMMQHCQQVFAQLGAQAAGLAAPPPRAVNHVGGAPPAHGAPPPAHGAPPAGYGAPPAGFGAPPPAHQGSGEEATMMPGHIRQALGQAGGPPPAVGGPPPAVGGPPPAVGGPPPAVGRPSAGFPNAPPPVGGPPPAGGPVGGAPPRGYAPPAGPPPASSGEEATMMPGHIRQALGQPPPAVGAPPAATPPGGGASDANQRTMIAGDASALLAAAGIKPGQYGQGPGQQQGPPPGPPAAFGAGAQPDGMRTMIADGSNFGGAAAGVGAAAGGAAPAMPRAATPDPNAPQKTMMLGDTEGILSLEGKPAASVEMPDASEQTGMTRAPGATPTFWIICLLTGLSIGVLAYLAVLKFGG